MKMTQDAQDFLSTLLSLADSPDHDSRPLKDATIYDFSPAFIAAVESYLSELWERMTEDEEMAGMLDECSRSFGGNAYLSGSGHGAGFFDEYPVDGEAIQSRYDEISGRYRFEELGSMIDNSDAGIDLAILPEYLESARAKLFTL